MFNRKNTVASTHQKSTTLAAPGMTGRDRIKRAAAMSSRQILVEAFEPRVLMSNYFVTNLNASGPNSLAADLALALNAGGSSSAIFFQSGLSGTITETTPDTNASATGAGPSAFVINNNVSITINGADGGTGISLSGNSAMRLFYIASGASLQLDDITLTDGLAQGGNGGSGNLPGGGGAGLGGAVFVKGGSLTIQRSTLNANQAIGGNGGSWGIDYNGGGGGGMSGNGTAGSLSGGGAGGGVNGGAASTSGGFGGGGGGSGSSTSAGSGGFGGGGGGGSASYSSSGGAGGFGGGGGSGPSGAGVGLGGFGGGAGVSLVYESGGGGAGMGGAIFNDAGTVTLENSTLTSNTAQGGGGYNSGQGLGGAVFNYNGTLNTTNATISGNTANDGDGIYNLGDGSSGTATAVINNTIIGQSSNTIIDFDGNAIYGGTNTTSGVGNLIRTQSGFNGTVVSTANPLLGSLANNGGDTQTLLPASNSPVIGAGVVSAVGGATADQLGNARVVSTNVDIGSIEVAALVSTPAVTGNPSSVTVNAGGNTTFTSTATGTPTPTEQWQVSTNNGSTFTNITDGGVYSGSTTATLTITGATAGMNGYEYQDVFTNSQGSATTTAATLTVDVAPSVTTNPSSVTINTGSNTSFTAAATGNPTPTVQWQVSTNGGSTFSSLTNGGIYSGVTTGTLTLTNATNTQNGYMYRAFFSNTLSGASSSSISLTTAATLTVDVAPAVTTNPSSVTINTGSNTSFTAAATGNPTPTVQWQVSTDDGNTFSNLTNGGIYSGVTTGTLTLTNATSTQNGYMYHAVFSNTLSGASSTSTATTTAATLTVDVAPAVTTNPSSVTINTGTNTSFTAAATGNPTPTVQWQVSTNGGYSFSYLSNGGIYSGVTTGTLTLTNATNTQNGYMYRALFSNTLSGASTASISLTTAATLTVDIAPAVTTNPSSVTINTGSNTSFTAAATGNPTPTVQWQVSTDDGNTFSSLTNGGIYSGVTTGTLTLTNATSTQNGYMYHAVFNNTLSGASSASAATTTAATLTVDAAPAVTTNPSSVTINTGSSTSFTVAATGNPAPAVQWQVSTDGGNTFSNLTDTGIYSGVTTDTLNLTNATLAENGYEYQAVFSNTLFGAGSPSTATTTAAALTVDAAPVVAVNPTSATINAGDNESFTSSATGNPVPTEQWQVSTDGGATFTNITDGGVYSGSTTGTLSITGGTADMNGDEYQDVFTNQFGAANTTPATLTVDYAPTVTENPTSETVNAGTTASFTVAATGNPAPDVQWQVSTDGGSTFTNLTNDGIYSGADTDTLTVTDTTLTENGHEYQAVFSNSLLGAGSASTATSTPAILTVGTPVITVNPYAQLVSSASNTGTLHVQAQQDGTDSNLIYTWSILSQPTVVSSQAEHTVSAEDVSSSPAPLAIFAINGTNAAKNTPVTFLASGEYTLQVVASNGITSATSQVQVTAKVKASTAAVVAQTTRVAGVQPISSGQSITGFVVTFTGAVDPTTAQNVLGYRIFREYTVNQSRSFWQQLFGQSAGTQTDLAAYPIASAVYDPQTLGVTLTLATPMPMQNGTRLVEVLGTGKHAVLDASGKAIDGDFNGKPGGNFTYRFTMSVAKTVSYKTTSGDLVKLSLSGPGKIVTIMPSNTATPVIDLLDTDPADSILTGTLHKGRKGLGYAVIDQLNGSSSVDVQLGDEFHVNAVE